uniref:Uncharacterized protein n=1 Tax=Solanum tuberosum TaxID=4113 RepID=M1CE48_SOLTU
MDSTFAFSHLAQGGPIPYSSHPAYKNRRTGLEGGKMRKQRRIEKIGPKAHSLYKNCILLFSWA